MNIRTNSLHFKFMAFFFPYEADGIKFHRAVSVCKYVRLLLCSLIAATGISLVAVCAVYSILVDPILYFVRPELSAFHGLVALLAVSIFTVGFLYLWTAEKLESLEENGVFFNFVRSVKEKTCIIMYVDKDQKESNNV